MDTSVLEYTAEDLIAHKLQRAGLLVAKPRFDQQGADLLALTQVGDGAKFCRIQCKGRTLLVGGRTEVQVATNYVTRGFVLFLFLETGNFEQTNLYCFFEGDINAWKVRDKNRVLALNAGTWASELKGFEASAGRIEEIRNCIGVSDVAAELEALTVTIGPAVEIDTAMPLGPHASSSGGTIGQVVEISKAEPLGPTSC